MTEREDFLSRWSRRKRAAAEGSLPAEQALPPDAAASSVDAERPEGEGQPVSAVDPAAEPAFDVSRLPSIDSIGADTDVSVFLKPGVPAELRTAALRRAWVIDPAIRDFKGLQEYDWDFNVNGQHGFAELGPDVDVRALVNRVFGSAAETAAAAEPSLPSPPVEHELQHHQSVPPTDEVVSRAEIKDRHDDEMLQREENAASQQDESAEASSRNKTRRHGSALPT